MLITRRMALLSSVGFLTACTSNGNASPGLVKAVQVADAVVTSSLQEAPLISGMFPKALPPPLLMVVTNPSGTGYLDLANQDLKVLEAALAKQAIPDAQGASLLDKIESNLNLAFTDLAPVLSITGSIVPGFAQAQAILQDAILAAPLIEAFINSVKIAASAPVAAGQPLARRAGALPMRGLPHKSPDQAYADLRAKMHGG